jgi:hypothetical protein
MIMEYVNYVKGAKMKIEVKIDSTRLAPEKKQEIKSNHAYPVETGWRFGI